MSQTDRTSKTYSNLQKCQSQTVTSADIRPLYNFAQNTVLRLTPPNNKAHIALKRNKKQQQKIGLKTELKRTANVHVTNLGVV